MLAPGRRLCDAGRSGFASEVASVSPESIQSFFALGVGFAFAGMLATAYQALMHRPASFHLLQRGPRPSTFAAIPLLAFAAPYVIMRNTIRGRRIEKRRFQYVMLSTILAGFWSMMSGTAVLMALQAIGLLHT
jgi:acetylornithine/succinyldiaminopimelate/putrescine aminotransferase